MSPTRFYTGFMLLWQDKPRFVLLISLLLGFYLVLDYLLTKYENTGLDQLFALIFIVCIPLLSKYLWKATERRDR